MRIKRPGTGTILGGVALFVALSGTAVAAAPTMVNIADPTVPTQIAKVDPTGHLKVGDGSGPLTVDGSVQLAAPGALYHATQLIVDDTACRSVAAAPTGKALILRDMRVNVFSNPSPGSGNAVVFYTDSGCAPQTIVADVNPPSVGLTVVPFDPGFAIASGQGLYAEALGSVEAETYADGYAVAAGQVPASITHVNGQRQQR